MDIISILLTITASVISGMTLYFLQRYSKRNDIREDKRAEIFAKENILILKSILAVAKLTEANAIALKNGHANGEISSALADYSKVEKELFEFLLKQNSTK